MLQKNFRHACNSNTLDEVSKIYLLEILELRSLSWEYDDGLAGYYRQKLSMLNVMTM